MKNLKGILAVVLLLSSLSIHADEGMWMIQDINAALEKNMKARGLMLSAKEIYNADAPGTSVADAVVSLGFYCTGSLLSDKGLIITNHHCAYSNIAKLSTPEHNYLEEGFWAMSSEDEIPVEGESVYFLKRVFASVRLFLIAAFKPRLKSCVVLLVGFHLRLDALGLPCMPLLELGQSGQCFAHLLQHRHCLLQHALNLI